MAEQEVIQEKRMGKQAVILTVRASSLNKETGIALKDRVVENLGGGRQRFFVDLSQVSEVDTGGMALLLAIKRMVASSGTVAFLSVKGSVRQLLEITGFLKLFEELPSSAATVVEMESGTQETT